MRGVKISGEILNTPFFLFSGVVPSEIPGENHIKVTESGGGEDYYGGRRWLELPPGGLQVQPFTRWSDNFKAATSLKSYLIIVLSLSLHISSHLVFECNSSPDG